MKRLKNYKDTRRITQTGVCASTTNGRPADIIIQQPELFMLNMQQYMQAVDMAENFDYNQRSQLYDMYKSAMLDLHLDGVIDKRLRGVTRLRIEFLRDGKPDEAVSEQIKSPWFKELLKDLVMSKFWGFTLVQFYRNEDGDIRYDLIPRKHYNPITHKLLRYQSDVDGRPLEEFDNMLFVGDERKLGCLASIMPAILYKRGSIADWYQFCNIFGMPIREYTYDAGDEEARKRLIADARRQGSNAVYIHPKGSDLNFIESGNKTGSSDLYSEFTKYWDSEISIRVLGNTLTTDAKETGTQALGTVHKEEETDMNKDDCDFLLDTLNYDVKPIFEALGFNVQGGEFTITEQEKQDPAQQLMIVQGLKNMGLPLDDDWLYETFKVQKPADYDKKKADAEAQKEALRQALTNPKDPDSGREGNKRNSPSASSSVDVKNRLRSFFGLAPQTTGADTDF